MVQRQMQDIINEVVSNTHDINFDGKYIITTPKQTHRKRTGFTVRVQKNGVSFKIRGVVRRFKPKDKKDVLDILNGYSVL